MDFDFKVTTWERVTVPEEHEEQVLRLIKEGEITSAEDVFKYEFDANCNKLDDTDVQMTPDENGGNSTIEVVGDNGSHVFWNGNEEMD